MNQKKQTGYEPFSTYSICHTEVWQMLFCLPPRQGTDDAYTYERDTYRAFFISTDWP